MNATNCHYLSIMDAFVPKSVHSFICVFIMLVSGLVLGVLYDAAI